MYTYTQILYYWTLLYTYIYIHRYYGMILWLSPEKLTWDSLMQNGSTSVLWYWKVLQCSDIYILEGPSKNILFVPEKSNLCATNNASNGGCGISLLKKGWRIGICRWMPLRLFQHTFGTHPEQPLPTGHKGIPFIVGYGDCLGCAISGCVVSFLECRSSLKGSWIVDLF